MSRIKISKSVTLRGPANQLSVGDLAALIEGHAQDHPVTVTTDAVDQHGTQLVVIKVTGPDLDPTGY